MRIENLSGGRMSEVSASFIDRDEVYKVLVRSQGVLLHDSPDAWITLGLLPAMQRDCDELKVQGEVSTQLLNSLQLIQDILLVWDPSLSRVRTPEEGTTRTRAGRSRVGAFFSGGADSFFTLLKHQEEITDLVFVDQVRNLV